MSKEMREYIDNFKNFLLKENVKNDDKIIYDLVSDWVISSLDDTEKRQKIGEKLLKVNIPKEYKKVPNNTLYRIGEPKNKFVSYTYDYRGIDKMVKWYKKIFNKKVYESDIIVKSVSDVNILICVPTFLKKTGFSSGRRFDSIWKSEYEVICVNEDITNMDKIENFILSGKDFKEIYATDFGGRVAKVLYTKNLGLGSNLGKGSYWNVTQDSLDIYSGRRDDEFDSKYGDYFKEIIYKEIDDDLKIFVKDEIVDDLMDNQKLYDEIKNVSDGIYDPTYDDYGLVLFEN